MKYKIRCSDGDIVYEGNGDILKDDDRFKFKVGMPIGLGTGGVAKPEWYEFGGTMAEARGILGMPEPPKKPKRPKKPKGSKPSPPDDGCREVVVSVPASCQRIEIIIRHEKGE